MQILINTISLGTVYMLVSIGFTLIFGVLNIVNFAHADLMMIAMYISYLLNVYTGLDIYVSILVIMPLFFFIGIAVEKGLFHPTLELDVTAQVCVGVALALILQNIILLTMGANYCSPAIPYLRAYNLFGAKATLAQTLALLVSIVLIVGLFLLLFKTYVGKAIRAVSQNRISAELLGINVSRVYGWTFGLGVSYVAVAGVILLPTYPVYPSIGLGFVLIAFFVVVFGGYNSLLGTCIAAVIIAFIEQLTSRFLTSQLINATTFGFIIFVLLIRPTGLFGSTEST